MARQKNQELRQEILKAAYQRFMRDDYNNILLKDIAADCGISVSLLHHYFATKADIIINIIYDLLRKIQLFIIQKNPEDVGFLNATTAFYELIDRMFVDVLVRNNNQMLRIYTYVLCDAKLMNKVIDFCITNLAPSPELKDKFEKRYEIYIYYGSFAQVVLLYLKNRLPTSLYETSIALYQRRYLSLGYSLDECEKIQSRLDEITNQAFLDEFYQEYLLSLDDFVLCEWN